MTEYFALAWYLDISTAPYTYGLTYWRTYEIVKTEREPGYSQPRKITVCKSELLSAESGSIEPNDLLSFVQSTILKECFNTKSVVVFDNIPELRILGERLECHSIEFVNRKAAISEQVMKYRLLFNKGDYLIPAEYLFTSDLIFSDVSPENILDPVYTDEQKTFPMSQSFLIAGHYIDGFYDALLLYPGSFSV